MPCNNGKLTRGLLNFQTLRTDWNMCKLLTQLGNHPFPSHSLSLQRPCSSHWEGKSICSFEFFEITKPISTLSTCFHIKSDYDTGTRHFHLLSLPMQPCSSHFSFSTQAHCAGHPELFSVPASAIPLLLQGPGENQANTENTDGEKELIDLSAELQSS